MTLQPLAPAPRTQMPATEVPGLAYYSAPTVPAMPPRVGKPAYLSRGAEALVQMYGYYTAAD